MRSSDFHSAPGIHQTTFSHWSVWALIGICVLAAALRLHNLTVDGLGYDELTSMTTMAGRNAQGDLLPRGQLLQNVPILTSLKTARPVRAVVTSLENDNHPPLYFLTLRFWLDCFGDGDYAARGLSVVFSILAIVLFFDAARIAEGPVAAVLACLIMALAIPQTRYAQETRMYAMSLAMEMLALSALLRIEHRGATSPRLWALGMGLAGMLFSNYLTAPTCLAIGIYALLRLKGSDRIGVLWTGITVVLLFLALCGPLIWLQRGPASHRGAYWEWDYAPGHLARTLFRAGAIPLKLMQPPLERSQNIAEIGAVLFLLPFLLLRRKPIMLLWGLMLLLPVLFIMAVDFYRTSNEMTRIRYLLLAGPAEYIMLAGLLSGHPRPLVRWCLPALAALGCALAIPTSQEIDRIDFRPLALDFDRQVSPHDMVVFSGGSWGPNITGALLLGMSRYSHAFPRPFVLLDTPASPNGIVKQLSHCPRLWFVCAGPQETSKYLPGFVDDQEHYYVNLGYLHAAHWAGSHP